jgi:hypothetical protein
MVSRGIAEWRKVKDAIRRALWRWFGHKQDVVDSGAQTHHGGHAHPQMSYDRSVYGNPAVRPAGQRLARGQSHLGNPVEQSHEVAVKINEGRVGVGDDWRRYVGFVGDGNIPWLWEDSEQRWLPVTESSRAAAYARIAGS